MNQSRLDQATLARLWDSTSAQRGAFNDLVANRDTMDYASFRIGSGYRAKTELGNFHGFGQDQFTVLPGAMAPGDTYYRYKRNSDGTFGAEQMTAVDNESALDSFMSKAIPATVLFAVGADVLGPAVAGAEGAESSASAIGAGTMDELDLAAAGAETDSYFDAAAAGYDYGGDTLGEVALGSDTPSGMGDLTGDFSASEAPEVQAQIFPYQAPSSLSLSDIAQGARSLNSIYTVGRNLNMLGTARPARQLVRPRTYPQSNAGQYINPYYSPSELARMTANAETAKQIVQPQAPVSQAAKAAPNSIAGIPINKILIGAAVVAAVYFIAKHGKTAAA